MEMKNFKTAGDTVNNNGANTLKKTFKEELEERWAEEENYLNSLPEEEAIAYCKAKIKEFEQYEKEYFNK